MSAQAGSDDNSWYLASHTKIELLLCGWPAWPHLIAPGTHAMNVAFRHLPSLQSFLTNPSVHIAAAADPRLYGGSFVALSASDVSAVQQLIQRTTERCSELLAFARDYRELNGLLERHPRGSSLDEIYKTLPPTLRGVVELVYDLNNHPKIKLFEELLYADGLGRTDMEEICFHTTPADKRSFFMSTPVLERNDSPILRVPFSDPRIDQIVTLRSQPGPARQLLEQLGDHKPERILTRDPPVRTAPDYAGDGVRVRYFGHACVLLQTAHSTILLDPLTAWERDPSVATLTFDDLPDRLDYVVLTHCHQDHCVPEQLIQLRSRIRAVVVPRNERGNLADPSMKLILRRLGLTNVLSVDPFESVPLVDGELQSLPFTGEHAGLNIDSKHCLAARICGRTLVFLVDSDCVDPALYHHIANRLITTDILFIGMECHGAPLKWLYGPLLSSPISREENESRRLSGSNSERAWAVVEKLQPAQVFVYAMGQEPWLRSLTGLSYQPDSIQLREAGRLIDRCRVAGIAAERLYGCREWIL